MLSKIVIKFNNSFEITLCVLSENNKFLRTLSRYEVITKSIPNRKSYNYSFLYLMLN